MEEIMNGLEGEKKKTINAIVSAEQKNIEARTKEKEKQTNVGAKVSKRNWMQSI